MSHWARDYFEKGYAQRWGLPPVSDRVRLQVGGLCKLLQLGRDSCVIDIACGHGRHTLAFAERGYRVIGVDFAVALLARAQELAADLGVRASWVRADMRRLPLKSDFAESVIVTDSLGLFESDEENEATLQEAARILSPSGALALKVVNAELPCVSVFASPDGAPFDAESSPTMWVVARPRAA